MPTGMPSALSPPMIGPSPPRSSPAPPESVRYSEDHISTVAMVSVISTGTLRTPLGKAVADRPSSLGRAPVPPEWNDVTLNGVAFCSTAVSPSTLHLPPLIDQLHS